MNNLQITNEMLYELLKEFKNDMRDFKHDTNQKFDELRANQREDHKILMDIWESRDKVIARVTWDFVWKATAFNAILLAFMLIILKGVGV